MCQFPSITLTSSAFEFFFSGDKSFPDCSAKKNPEFSSGKCPECRNASILLCRGLQLIKLLGEHIVLRNCTKAFNGVQQVKNYKR